MHQILALLTLCLLLVAPPVGAQPGKGFPSGAQPWPGYAPGVVMPASPPPDPIDVWCDAHPHAIEAAPYSGAAITLALLVWRAFARRAHRRRHAQAPVALAPPGDRTQALIAAAARAGAAEMVKQLQQPPEPVQADVLHLDDLVRAANAARGRAEIFARAHSLPAPTWADPPPGPDDQALLEPVATEEAPAVVAPLPPIPDAPQS